MLRARSTGPTRIVASLAACLTALLLTTATAYGQASNTATIRGTVEDSSGGVLPGATVTLTNAATKAVTVAVTDDRGGYLFTGVFGGQYEIKVELSTRPENRLGADEEWDAAEAALAAALERRGLAYVVNAGDGAFYGPKIDLHMLDSLGRAWQLGTVQLEVCPFDCYYMNIPFVVRIP